MEKEFVSYEIAMKLNELGFNEPCFGFYHLGVFRLQDFEPYFKYKNEDKAEMYFAGAPLWQQVIDWLREEKSCYIESVTTIVNSFGMVDTEYRVLMIYYGEHPASKRSKYSMRDFKEKSLESAILKALELITKK